MERPLKLLQPWEGHVKEDVVFVHEDTFDLLVKNEMGKELETDDELKRSTARAQEQAKAAAEETARLGLDEDKIKEIVTDIVTREREGAPPPHTAVEDKVIEGGERGMKVPTAAAIGWKGTAEFWHFVALATRKQQPFVDPRLTDKHITKLTGWHEEGDDTLGGYLVPDDVKQELLKERLENTIVRGNGARVIPTMRDNIVLATIDDTSHATTVFGNVIFYWINEQAALTPRNLVFGQIQIPIEKLAGLCYITRELLADAYVSVEAEIRQSFTEGAAWFEDHAFIIGTGAGQPMGYRNSAALIAIARAGVGAIAWADIANIYSRQRYPGRAVWVANQAVLPQLLQMVGGTEVIWIGLSAGATAAPPGTLLGRPIVFTEKVPTLGTQGDLGFIDFSQYLIGDREVIRIDRSDDVQFTTDQVALRFILRVGGRPRPAVAFQPHEGNTLSPFVELN